ncbi:MAG TPA: hypothetical protein VMV94_06260 [Phycisphaerae bacterium]|nr:hypothetical protein [Phycisphaerae bacterium]
MRISRLFLGAALTLAALAPVAGPRAARGDQLQQGPFEGLYGGYHTHHPFTNLPHVVGSVTVELKCLADLGCDGWDYYNCFHAPYGCDISPEDKWVTLRIAGVAINGTLPYIGEPTGGGPPVPEDGRFFREWEENSCDEAYQHYGISDCSGYQCPNIHRFTVTQGQWNTWVTAGSRRIDMYVTSSGATMNLPVYCNLHASGDGCCDWETDPSGDCSRRPGSNATITITYSRSGRCCYADATCEETSHDNCTAMGGVWTDGGTCGAGACPAGACCNGASCTVTTEAGCVGGTWVSGGTCSPNPCGETQTGACCYGSGLCVMDTQAHCVSAGGTSFHGGDSCERNPCTQPLPIIYVDQSVTGTHDGNFWSTAWPDLQSALNDVPTGASRRIWVAQGT